MNTHSSPSLQPAEEPDDDAVAGVETEVTMDGRELDIGPVSAAQVFDLKLGDIVTATEVHSDRRWDLVIQEVTKFGVAIRVPTQEREELEADLAAGKDYYWPTYPEFATEMDGQNMRVRPMPTTDTTSGPDGELKAIADGSIYLTGYGGERHRPRPMTEEVTLTLDAFRHKP